MLAGIQEQRPSPAVHQGPVGVAEEKQIQLPLFCGKARRHQGGLDAIGVAVAQEDALAPDLQQLLVGSTGRKSQLPGTCSMGRPGSGRGAAPHPASSPPDGRSGPALSALPRVPWEPRTVGVGEHQISIESSFQRPFPQYSRGRRRMQILSSNKNLRKGVDNRRKRWYILHMVS